MTGHPSKPQHLGYIEGVWLMDEPNSSEPFDTLIISICMGETKGQCDGPDHKCHDYQRHIVACNQDEQQQAHPPERCCRNGGITVGQLSTYDVPR